MPEKKKCKYVEKKYGCEKEFVDLEARNSFQLGKVTSSMIKCAWTQSLWIKGHYDK